MATDPKASEEPADVEFTFRIGDVFPSSDPVARFVTGVAMISNDLGRLFRILEELDQVGPRLMLYRFQLSLHFEAFKFLREAQRQYSEEIGRFLSSLPAEAQEIHATLVDEDHLRRARAEETRNTSFHYPRVLRARFDRGEEEMANLLDAAADHPGEVEASSEPGFLEYRFADEVALKMLPMTEENELDENAIVAFRERALAFRRFAELVVNHYVDGKPNDDLEKTDVVEEESGEGNGEDPVG